MKYVRYGDTGIKVSQIGFGCMTYGDPAWHEWVLDEKAAQPFFKAALEAGINYCGTADLYSHGRSEEVTGRALKAMARREEEREMIALCRAEGIAPTPYSANARSYLAGNTLSGGTTTRGSTDQMTRNLRFGASDEDRAIADRVAKSPRVSACRASVVLGLVLGEESAKFLEEPYRAKPVTGHE